MTQTLLSLLGIFFGILSANVLGFYRRNTSFGITGNSILGVFGSILFSKAFKSFGLHPNAIVTNSEINFVLLLTYLVVSAFGGIALMLLVKKIKSTLKN